MRFLIEYQLKVASTFFPKIESNCSAKISPVPGLLTQIFSIENFSPAIIFFIVTTDAYKVNCWFLNF